MNKDLIRPNIAKEIYSRDDVYDLYVTQGLTQKDVQNKLSISNKTLKILLDFYDIPIRSKSDSRTISAARMTQEQKDKIYSKAANTRKNRTPEQKKETLEKYKNTCLEHLGVEYPFQSSEIKEKSRNTSMEKYGVPHPMFVEEIKNKCVKASTETIRKRTREEQEIINAKSKATRENRTEEEKEAIRIKQSQARKIVNANMDPEVKRNMYLKALETKRKNNTFNTSIPEKELHKELIYKYGIDDVKTQYWDSRYPFRCDFYIPSEDLFIELNRFPTHYTEPFDSNNQEHLDLLEHCKTNPKNWIEEKMIDIWAGSDVKKREIAEMNNLNYQVIY